MKTAEEFLKERNMHSSQWLPELLNEFLKLNTGILSDLDKIHDTEFEMDGSIYTIQHGWYKSDGDVRILTDAEIDEIANDPASEEYLFNRDNTNF